MKYTTSLFAMRDGQEYIRGKKLSELIRGAHFADVIFFLLQGRDPSKAESTLFNSILVACIDHGPGTPSALTTRITASTKTSLTSAIAAGILACGEAHGGATGAAAAFFYEHAGVADLPDLLAQWKQQGKRIPGYGHRILTVDTRTEQLLAQAEDLGVASMYCAFARNLGTALANTSSKPLPLNIDGAIAAILLDMGFAPASTTGVFAIARLPGLVAHALEEIASNVGPRRLAEEDITYENTPRS